MSARVLGAVLGVLPGLLLTFLLVGAAAPRWVSEPTALIPALAMPIGAVLGWLHAPATIRSARLPAARLVRMGVEAVLLGVLGVASVAAGAAWVDRSLNADDALGNAAATIFLGSALLGIPMLVLTIPSAFLWGTLLRRAHRGKSDR